MRALAEPVGQVGPGDETGQANGLPHHGGAPVARWGRRFRLPGPRGWPEVFGAAHALFRILLVLLAATSALAAPPTITGAAPNPIDAGGPYFLLNVTGTGFVPGSIVSWTRSPLGTTYVSATQLQAAITPELRTTEGNYSITVTNPDGGASNSFAVSVSPVLLSVTPSAVLAGSPGIALAAKGLGFTMRVQLVLNAGGQQLVLPTTFVDSATLSATISASALSAAESATILVIDPMYNLSSSGVPFVVQKSPVITSALPNPIDAGGGYFQLNVTGTGFLSNSSVTWSGQPLGATYVSPTQLQADIWPAERALSGTFNIQVTNPPGVSSNQYLVTVSPVLFGISPVSAAAAGLPVTITATGAGFTHNSFLVLTQGSTQTTLTTTYVNLNTLTAVVPGSALRQAGAGSVQVADSTGPGHSLTQAFTIAVPVPSVGAISPSSATAGVPDFTLIVTGSYFALGAVVQWSGMALTTTFVTTTQLTAVVPAALVQAPGTAAITVLSPGATVSSSSTFTINPSIAVPPAITGAAPNPIDAGGPYFLLNVNGTGFVHGSTVNWSGTPLDTTYVNQTQLQAAITPELRSAEGKYNISVTNPGSTVSNSFAAGVLPVLLSVTPAAVITGSPGLTLTAKGLGFTARVQLALNAGGQQLVLPTTLVDSATLTAAISASALGTAQAATIQVIDPLNNLSSLALPFDVQNAPAIKSAAPNTFDAGGPSVVMSVNGSGFLSGSIISWSGQPLGTTYVSPTQLQATLAPENRGLSGTFSLRVANPLGAPSNPYTVTVSPVLFGVSPNSAAAAGPAVTITATGTGFTHNNFLVLTQGSNQTTLATTYVNLTTLTAVVPASALRLAGASTVQVADSTGSGHSLTQPFTISAPIPSLSAISPSSATAGAAAFTLVVTGSNFAPGAAVQWNGSPLATTFLNATQLTAAVPAALIQTVGIAGISVVNPAGTVSANSTFTINPPAPVVSSLDPGSASTGASAVNQAFNLTVNGANFAAGATVLWNASPLATGFVSSSKLVASVPASLLTDAISAAISVANPGGVVSNNVTFAINPPQPSINGVTPASVTAGGASFTLTATGLNFAANCVLRWNGTPLATAFVSDRQATAGVPADLIAIGGAAAITLINPSGLVSNPATLALVTPVPAIASISPNSAQAGSAGLTLAISGANFLANSAVLWNGSPLPATWLSATRLTAPVSAYLLAAPGAASVKVSTPGAADSNAAVFTIAPAALLAQPPVTSSAGIVNAASGLPGIAPGSLISIYGLNLAAGNAAAAALPLPNTLSGTTVTINGTAAPLIFVSPLQLNVQVPFETNVGTATLVVQAGSLKGAPVIFEVVAAAPGVLTMANSNHAVAQNYPDQALNSAGSPAIPGQYVTVYLTGQGPVDNPVPTGASSPAAPFSVPIAAIEARVGGQPAQIAFAGLAPGFVGLLQMNLVIPDIPSGEQPFEVSIGGVPANPTVLSVKAGQ